MHARRRRKRRGRVDVKAGCDDDDDNDNNPHLRDVPDDPRDNNDDEESFFSLVLRVGAVVAFVFVILGACYVTFIGPILVGDESSLLAEPTDDFLDNSNNNNNPLPISDPNSGSLQEEEEPEKPLFHQFPLSEFAQLHDAFAVANDTTNDHQNNKLFWQTAKGLRDRFVAAYTGDDSSDSLVARGILDTALHVVGGDASSVHATACRIQQARTEQRPFRMAFGGYSVTAGHGNYHSQSFPFVMEGYLRTVFDEIGVPLVVRNAAIGGCPSFPYGWCLHNFLGDHPDVVSWDFSMNEAGDEPAGLEAYIRRVLNDFGGGPPQLIVKDTHMAQNRKMVLEHYAKDLRDPIIIHTDPAVDPFLEDLDEDQRPPGFQNWRKFGSPPGAPGQSLHHPAVKEHEFIAWVLTMYFLSALEVVVLAGQKLDDCEQQSLQQATTKRQPLPRPLHQPDDTTSIGSTSLFFGLPDERGLEWSMTRVQCRTSFRPVVSGNLTDIVASGGTALNVNLMLPKSNMYFGHGWVYDLSDSEKKAKRKLSRFGGLGFVDQKPAYYGIYASGPLILTLPIQRKLKSVVVCEVNEIRPTGACENGKDIHFSIAGRNVPATAMRDVSTVYLGKSICVHLEAPKEHSVCPTTAGCFINVTLAVTNQHINRKERACSVSHVIWEEDNSTDPSMLQS